MIKKMRPSEEVKQRLGEVSDPEKAAFYPRFFQSGPGGYGEGDRFLGVTVPNQRKIARAFYRDITLAETEMLLHDEFHECRMTALFILVLKFERAKSESERTAITDLYLRNTRYINNWDLVDASAEKILGAWLWDKDPDLLYSLAASDNLWEQRIAVIATYYFIKQGCFDHTLQIAERLLDHRHDLIHKAVGWMLREVGNRDREAEMTFLYQHYKQMPRTMLRYAIEKFEPDLRQQILKGEL